MIHTARPWAALAALGLLLASGAAMTGCAGDTNGRAAEQAREAEQALSVVLAEDRTFTISDLQGAGWKRSKDFSVETLPHARTAAFGFFNQRDVEVWVYDSHDDALRHGRAPADEAIARRPGQTDYLIPVVNRYHAYAVAGNLILLCEVELADCEQLIARLP